MKENQVYILSLGCPKNLIDAEVMSALLSAGAFRITAEAAEADIIIINTCAFILPAKEESIREILQLAALKREGRCRHLVVTGCLPQRYGNVLAEELPEVDLFLGPQEVPRIAGRLKALRAGKAVGPKVFTKRPTFLMTARHPRLVSTPFYSAYLKIAEGCSNRCSYCVIPSIRGNLRSRAVGDIVEEAGALARGGVREIILVAQDTTAFGRDRKDKPSLPVLLRELARVAGLRWIRLLYTYPVHLTEELLETIAREDKICRYLDIPVQHIDDEILSSMNRKGNAEAIIEKIRLARRIVPGIVLRTSLIVGFPGETPEKFRRLRRFIEEVRFDHLGVFTYSREEGTAAFDLPFQVSERQKKARRGVLMRRQAIISSEMNGRRIGATEAVLVEGVSAKAGFPWVGRTRGQAPDIDGVTYLKAKDASIGDVVDCRIVGADVYDLFAEPL